MPINNEGIITPKETKKRVKINYAIVGLIATNIITIIGCIVSIYEIRLQKLEYEKDIEELDFEKRKYEDMLKESDIQFRNSYVVCELRDIESLYSSFEDYNVYIYSNEITDLFYDGQNHCYYEGNDIMFIDHDLKGKYNSVYTEVIFLRIDTVSNRIIKDASIDSFRICEEHDIDGSLFNFASMQEYYKENGSNITIKIGDIVSNDMILILVAIRYSEMVSDYVSNDLLRDLPEQSTYKIIYIPNSISCYDTFYEKTLHFEIRDLLEGSFITNYKYVGLG